jgi:cell division protein FtsI (penicillin-binding protein 3)
VTPLSRPAHPAEGTVRRSAPPVRSPGPVRSAGPPVRRVPRPPARRRRGDPRTRLRVGAALIALLLGFLGVRLVQLQGFDTRAFADQAAAQRLRTIPLPAHRGAITDRSGAPLAFDVDARLVYADPRLVDDPAVTAEVLSPLLRRSTATLQELLVRRGRYVPLARGVEPAVATAVTELGLPGIGLVPERSRVYPSGSLAANVLGFAGRDGTGLAGVEAAYDRLLAGRDGRLTVEQDPAGRIIPAGRRRELSAQPGADLRLTLDRDLQWYAQEAITAQVRATQANGGTIIVMDPLTGDLLAMAQAPTYDLRDPGKSEPAVRRNAATADVYEPGSVNKVITAAAALEAGIVTPETEVVIPASPPGRVYGTYRFNDAESHPVERLTFAGVLAKSSNLGTIDIGMRLGKRRLEAALRAFGLGAPTGLDFPGESRGLLPPSSAWTDSQVAAVPIGQGVSATALQIAGAYATIAAGGVRRPPRLVDGWTDARGLRHSAPRSAGQRVVSPQTAASVSAILEHVTTENGTAPKAAVPGYRVAGKTGTARRPAAGGYRGYVASFVGYAPADRPRLLVSVVVDYPRTGIYGGSIAAPVFQDVMAFGLRHLRVPPTGTRAPELALEAGAGVP